MEKHSQRWLRPNYRISINALCSKSNGRCDIKAEKREELESKCSHKSDIWPPAVSKKWGEIYWKYIFQTLEAIFPYKGVFFTKVVKANIIAFIKTKILRPVLSVTNPPSKNVSPYCIVHWISTNCPEAELVVKADDDFFIDIPLLRCSHQNVLCKQQTC